VTEPTDKTHECPRCCTPISPARLEELATNPGRWMYCEGGRACGGQVRLLPPEFYWDFPRRKPKPDKN
jgi:hypothetical protein